MIYLEETLNLVPASPETLDTFVGFAQEEFVDMSAPWLSAGHRLVQ